MKGLVCGGDKIWLRLGSMFPRCCLFVVFASVREQNLAEYGWHLSVEKSNYLLYIDEPLKCQDIFYSNSN